MCLGERPIAQDNKLVWRIQTLWGHSSADRYSHFHCLVMVDVNGILTMTTKEKGAKNKKQIEITNHTSRLSKQEIDGMVVEAKKYNADDEERMKVVKS